MSERDFAEAMHHQIISPDSVDAAVNLWQQYHELNDRSRIWRVLARTSASAIDAVLAHTGPWDAPSEERERCARQIEAIAINIRDNGPKTPEGLLTALAGAQVGILFDAAAVLRRTQ